MTERLRVGFIGLGYMGHGMARRILARGFPLTVMAHRKREATDDLLSRGAREAARSRVDARVEPPPLPLPVGEGFRFPPLILSPEPVEGSKDRTASRTHSAPARVFPNPRPAISTQVRHASPAGVAGGATCPSCAHSANARSSARSLVSGSV